MSVTVIRTEESAALERAENREKTSKGDLLGAVRVTLEVRLGQSSMTIDEMLALKKDSIVALENGLADPVALYLNGTIVARGEIVAVGDKFGVRIVEIAPAS